MTFCVCIHNELLPKVKKLNYICVGLGDDKFDDEWITDNIGQKHQKIILYILFIIGFEK